MNLIDPPHLEFLFQNIVLICSKNYIPFFVNPVTFLCFTDYSETEGFYYIRAEKLNAATVKWMKMFSYWHRTFAQTHVVDKKPRAPGHTFCDSHGIGMVKCTMSQEASLHISPSTISWEVGGKPNESNLVGQSAHRCRSLLNK